MAGPRFLEMFTTNGYQVAEDAEDEIRDGSGCSVPRSIQGCQGAFHKFQVVFDSGIHGSLQRMREQGQACGEWEVNGYPDEAIARIVVQA